MATADIRTLVIDDHQSFAEALSLALGFEDGIVSAGSTSDVEGALRRMAAENFDVIVIDYQLPGLDGIEGIRRLRVADKRVKLLMITGHDDAMLHHLAVLAGAATVLPKASSIAEIASIIRRCADGATFEPSAPMGDEDHPRLSPRELEVLTRLSKGRDTTAIAGELFLSVHTVRGYVKDLLNKLGAHSQLEAVAIGRRRGFLPDR